MFRYPPKKQHVAIWSVELLPLYCGIYCTKRHLLFESRGTTLFNPQETALPVASHLRERRGRGRARGRGPSGPGERTCIFASSSDTIPNLPKGSLFLSLSHFLCISLSLSLSGEVESCSEIKNEAFSFAPFPLLCSLLHSFSFPFAPKVLLRSRRRKSLAHCAAGKLLALKEE